MLHGGWVEWVSARLGGQWVMWWVTAQWQLIEWPLVGVWPGRSKPGGEGPINCCNG